MRQRGTGAAEDEDTEDDRGDDRPERSDERGRDVRTEERLRRTGGPPQGRAEEDEERTGAERAGGPQVRAQKVALSPQAQEPDELGFSMENPDASSDSFQSMTAPER